MFDKILIKNRAARASLIIKTYVFFIAFAMATVLLGGILGENRVLWGYSGVIAEHTTHIEAQTLENNGSVLNKIPSGDKAGSAKKEKATNKSLAARPGEFVYSSNIPMNRELQEYTYNKCVERGLEYELVLAIIWRESRFDIDAVNVNEDGTMDNGIMQINDINKEWLYEKYGIDDLMDPYQNIDAGTAMLGSFTDKYGSHGAMLAYQFGEMGMTQRVQDGLTTSNTIEIAYSQRDYYRQLV